MGQVTNLSYSRIQLIFVVSFYPCIISTFFLEVISDDMQVSRSGHPWLGWTLKALWKCSFKACAGAAVMGGHMLRLFFFAFVLMGAWWHYVQKCKISFNNYENLRFWPERTRIVRTLWSGPLNLAIVPQSSIKFEKGRPQIFIVGYSKEPAEKTGHNWAQLTGRSILGIEILLYSLL